MFYSKFYDLLLNESYSFYFNFSTFGKDKLGSYRGVATIRNIRPDHIPWKTFVEFLTDNVKNIIIYLFGLRS